MPTEFAAGVIVFRRREDQTEYLLLRSARGYWEFPKGHLEAGETWPEAAARELREEAGIEDAVAMPGFTRQIQYFFNDRRRGLVRKTVAFLLAETRRANAHISDEHTQAVFLPFDQALRRLTHAGTRALLRDAERFLNASDS